MSSTPSTSKPTVSFGDKNFEEQLMQWYDEASDDCSDVEDCEESFAINSAHETDSETEGE